MSMGLPTVLRAGFLLVVGAGVSLASIAEMKTDRPVPSAVKIERGRYLANNVAMCVVCHSPQEAIEEQSSLEHALFTGGTIGVEQPSWSETWSVSPPNLRILADTDPKRIYSVLTQGVRPDGTDPDNPMPPFRMTPADADAVVAYLRSLP